MGRVGWVVVAWLGLVVCAFWCVLLVYTALPGSAGG